MRRFRSPDRIVDFVNGVARETRGGDLPARELPAETLTDGRSFLARGMAAVTLRAFTGDSFPMRHHSERDSRERLSTSAIARSVELLAALVARADLNSALLMDLATAEGP